MGGPADVQGLVSGAPGTQPSAAPVTARTRSRWRGPNTITHTRLCVLAQCAQQDVSSADVLRQTCERWCAPARGGRCCGHHGTQSHNQVVATLRTARRLTTRAAHRPAVGRRLRTVASAHWREACPPRRLPSPRGRGASARPANPCSPLRPSPPRSRSSAAAALHDGTARYKRFVNAALCGARRRAPPCPLRRASSRVASCPGERRRRRSCAPARDAPHPETTMIHTFCVRL
jgi:hypothetical protein